jgi:hypothetical protein
LSHHPAHQQATQQTQRYYPGNQNFLQHLILPSDFNKSMNAITAIYHLEMQLEQFTANPCKSPEKLSLTPHIIAALCGIY